MTGAMSSDDSPRSTPPPPEAVVHPALRAVQRRAHRLRRAWLVRQLKLAARLAGATIEVDIAPDLRIDGRVRVVIAGGEHNVVRIGPHCHIGDDVMLVLKGGALLLGEWSDIRRGVILNVGGRLELVRRNILSFGCVVHCMNNIRLEDLVGAADHVTFADFSHYFTDDDTAFHHNVSEGSISVGYNTWIGAKATLARNAKVGSHCIVAANSLVVGTVPDRHLASGVPATARPLGAD